MKEPTVNVRQHKSVRTVIIYGSMLAFGTLLLQWMEYQYLLRQHSAELTLVILCTLFSLIGIWFGLNLNRSSKVKFKTDFAMQSRLNISKREMDVLLLLAQGHNTQEISDQLFISINTVKTHLQRLYEKLEAPHRGQAIRRAREFGLVP